VASAADTLQESIPALAGYVRNAATYTNKFADNLRDLKAERLSPLFADVAHLYEANPSRAARLKQGE